MQTLLSNGFNVVVGNPPYMQLNKSVLAKMYKNSQYTVFDKIGNLYCLFYVRGIELLKEDGYLAYITSNSWMKSIYGEILRKYFSKYNVIKLINFGCDVFKDAQVEINIIILQKNTNNSNYTLCCDYKQEKSEHIKFICKELPKDGSNWIITSESEIKKKIKEKIILQSRQIRDREDVLLHRGITTAYKDAFIINKIKRDEILNNCKTDEERIRTNIIIRPVLDGKNIKYYSIKYNNLYLINIHNGVKEINLERVKIEDYPAIKKHLDSYYEKLVKRSDKGDTPYNLRNCAYLPEFDKEKIIYPHMSYSKINNFYLDNNNFMLCNTSYMFIGKHLGFLTAFLNSELFNYYFKDYVATLGLTNEVKKNIFKTIYVKDVSEDEDKIFKKLVYEIQDKKRNKEDTTELEAQIDNMIYELYGLTEEEIEEVEKEVKNYIYN